MSSRSGDSTWMSRAVECARAGRLRVEPNPMVGAVLVDRDGGFLRDDGHAQWGGSHAEAGVLRFVERSSPERLAGATLYTTLEPCAHTEKKTPPCAQAIARAGIARVVAGAPDPNPATSGLAARIFAEAGVAFEVLPADDIDGEQCRALIGRYARHLSAGRPWVISKWAMSLDGRIADETRASRWISNESSRDVVWQFRERVDAVLVGVGTVLADDPELVSRRESARRPLRVVFDSHLRTPPAARLIATARETPTLLVAAEGCDAGRRARLVSAGAQVVEIGAGPDGRLDVREAMRSLHDRGVRRALLEAGGTLQGECLRAGVVDQVAVFVAPLVIGGPGPSPFAGRGWPIASAPRIEEPETSRIPGGDVLIEGYWPQPGA